MNKLNRVFGHPLNESDTVLHKEMRLQIKIMRTDEKKNGEGRHTEAKRITVSLKTLAQILDAHRSSVRRWLQEAGIHPIGVGRGRNGAIRYRWQDIENWLESLEYVE